MAWCGMVWRGVAWRVVRGLAVRTGAQARRYTGGPASGASRAPHLAATAQSTATRRPGDLCSVHAATFLTHYRELHIVSRFSVSRSLASTRYLSRPDPTLSNNFSELLKFPRGSLVCRVITAR